MDVQGNVIYLGMEWSYIENLMLGQISQVRGKEPRYPLMALQRALAASNDPDDDAHFIHSNTTENGGAFKNAIMKQHWLYSTEEFQYHPTVTETMIKSQCDHTLSDFCDETTSGDYFQLSKYVIQSLGYVDENMKLEMDHNALTMVWEMRNKQADAVHLCAVLEQLFIRFCYNKTKSFKESDSTQNEFLSVLLHVVDRVPANDGDESLQHMLRVIDTKDGKVANDDAGGLWLETEKILTEQKELIDSLEIPQEEKDKIHLSLPPATEKDSVGPALDKSVYEMVISKQKGFREGQSLAERNKLKDRIVNLGQVCMVAHNNLQQPHGPYSALEVHFRRMFRNIKYSVADMMNQLTDQEDLTEI